MPPEQGAPLLSGELAAVFCALCWALCSLGFAYAGKRVGSVAVNQVRIVLAVFLLAGLHQWLFGSVWPAGLNDRALWLLAISGVVGLAIGDQFYFYALSVIGPRLGSLLMATWPVVAALLAWPALGEAMTWVSAGGIALTTFGVCVVLWKGGDRSSWRDDLSPTRRALAIGAGLLGASCQAGGIVLAKLAFAEPLADGSELDGLSATLLRMIAGAVGCLLIGAAARHLAGRRGDRSQAHGIRALFRDHRALGGTLFGTLFGPTIGVWLSLIAVQRTATGTASALMALAPVMILPIAWLAYGSRPGWRGLLGTLIAITGVILLVTP